jgi:sulfatase maturation enzyme AslB (radical SAM superfamily)
MNNNNEVKKYHLSLILTHACNLNCVYCYENTKDKRYMLASTAKKIIEKHLNDINYDEIEIDFFGGEPFLQFDVIRDVCEWTWGKQWRNKYVFFATTNGTLVHGEMQEWLRFHKDRFWVSLSLDGTLDSHNVNRSNSFEEIDIPFFLECWPSQTVKMTISKQTINHIYDNIVYIHKLGFNIAGSNFAEGIDWEDEMYVGVLINQLEKLCQFYIDNPQYKPAPIINMPIHKCEEGIEVHKWCGCGEHMSAYDIDGKQYPCTFFTPMTFSSEQMNSILGTDFSSPHCFEDIECKKNCYLNPVCNSCYGANMLANGVINKRDRSKCRLTKIRAIYSAILTANRIIANPEDTRENMLAIKAVEKINTLYNKEN